MTNTTRLASLALIALITAGSASTDAFAMRTLHPPRYAPSVPHSPDDIDCRVKDDNFYITNFGDRNLDSGRQVSWRSPTTGDEGVILLPRMLAPGQEVELYGVLTDYAAAGAPCTVDFV